MGWHGRRWRVLLLTLRFFMVTVTAGGAIILLLRDDQDSNGILSDENLSLHRVGEGLLPPTGASHKVINALYRGIRLDRSEDLHFPLIREFLVRRLAKDGYILDLKVSKESCNTNTWALKKLDILIIGGGPVLNEQTLCILQHIPKDTIVAIAGSGYGDEHLYLKSANAMKTLYKGHAGYMKGKEKNVQDALSQLTKHKVFGGLRGVATKLVLDNWLKKPSLPVLGDILNTMPEQLTRLSGDSIYKKLRVPKSEKYVLITPCRNSTRTYENFAGKAVGELHTALLTLNHRYHIITYGLTKDDTPIVNAFTDKIRKAAQFPENKIVQLKGPVQMSTLGKLLRYASLTINCVPEANYLSSSFNVPFVGIATNFEMLDMLEQLDLSFRYGVVAQKLHAPNIVTKVNAVANDDEKLRAKLKAYNKEVRQNYTKLFQSLSLYLKSKKIKLFNRS